MTQHIVIEKRSNSAASISIALAIIGFVFSLIPFPGLFGVVGLFR